LRWDEQPDRAVDAFTEAAQLDPETVELHFALGNLFRRRGETDRAIRVHQNLLSRPDLKDDQRLHALYELGQDYLKAGLLDRAEEALGKLTGTSWEDKAREHLLDIYQLEKDWPRAIACAKALEAQTGVSRQKEVAQFHCEQAARALANSKRDEAQTEIDAALAANRKSVRAQLLQGDLFVQAGDTHAAIAAWQKIEQQDPAYLALVASRLADAYKADGRTAEGLTLLRGFLERYPSLDLMDSAFQATLELDGVEAAYKLVRDELKRHPTLLGYDRLLEAQVLSVPADAPPERRSDLDLVRRLVHAHTEKLSRYQCMSCGFKARQFHWRCPGCGTWEGYPPKRSEEVGLAQ
jgi:lipopolysaccharide assembly protein B